MCARASERGRATETESNSSSCLESSVTLSLHLESASLPVTPIFTSLSFSRFVVSALASVVVAIHSGWLTYTLTYNNIDTIIIHVPPP